MSDQNEKKDPFALWKSQTHNFEELSMDDLTRKSKSLSPISRRNFLEYTAAIVVLVIFGRKVLLAQGVLFQIAGVLVILATLYVVYHLVRFGGIKGQLQTSALPLSSIQFYRIQLERQSELLSQVWKWYLGPFVPGLLLFLLHFYLEATSWKQQLHIFFSLVVCLVGFISLGVANKRAARKLNTEIEGLLKEE